jgi:nicotinate-nucleotide--dimethylbenzimidazole phosphoribosyltransferase
MIDVPVPDAGAVAAARVREERLVKPRGALGRLEELAAWAAGVQGRCPPQAFRRVRAVVFAGDHGVARAGVSAYPPEVTVQMVATFLAGGAGVNVLARQVGASVRVLDLAVDGETPPAVAAHKVRRGSGRIDVEDALTAAEAQRAVATGMAIADEEVDGGADLLVPGDMGIGNTTPAAAVVAVLAAREPSAVVGRGTGVDDTGLARKAAAVGAAARRGRTALDAGGPVALLAAAGGADVAAMAGFLVQAAVRRTPVVLDGVVSGAAALVAASLAPHAPQWWLAGHRSTEPAHSIALDRLGLAPVLDLGLRLGEGTGALLAVPVLQAAVATLAEMATFDEAGVDSGA